MTLPRLVLVDDDDLLRSVLEGNLGQAGFDVQSYSDPLQALEKLPHAAPCDLLILDWKMPGMSGLELLGALRARGIATPTLFFTSHNDTLYEEAALAQGAVDFIDKTRSFAILLKRIELILGHAVTQPPDEDMTETGLLRLSAANHGAFWCDQPIELTFGEYRVVELLATAGRDVTYREIYDALRGENFLAGDGPDGYRANVRALIKRIREKFLAVDGDFTAIANYPGFGYRWDARNRDD